MTFEEGAQTFAFVIGEPEFLHTTANLQEVPAEGSVYTYVLDSGDPNAPFQSTMMLQLNADGTAVVSVTAAGPINATSITGTWAATDGSITVSW